MARILVVGSANVDLVVTVPRLPVPGETVSGGTLSTGLGGKGANQALVARRLGAEVRFVGRVGADAHGEALRRRLASEGVDVGGLAVEPGRPTGTALIAVDPHGRNQIAVAPGANASLTAGEVAARRRDFEWAEAVVCQWEVPRDAVRAALGLAHAAGALTVLNPAPVPAGATVRDAVPVDVLVPNESEACQLADVSPDEPIESVASRLHGVGAGLVVVTLGERGALALDGRSVERVAARAVEAVDTTGAGDAFTGALVVALVEGRALRAALEWATAAAALACTRRGAQDALPRRADVERLLGS